MRLALDHEHISATGLREMISNTRADNAAADDHNVRGFHLKEKVKRKKGKVKTSKPGNTNSKLKGNEKGENNSLSPFCLLPFSFCPGFTPVPECLR